MDVELQFKGLELAGVLIPYAGMVLAGFIVYISKSSNLKELENKNAARIEISKSITNPSHLESMLESFHEPKKQPIDYRRSGVVTLSLGVGFFLFGLIAIDILRGVGLLVAAIGVGSITAGYLYPNDSAEITTAVEKFEK